ncbi:magnesium and cobalt transport protein CorA [Croceivirga lutea]|uniref:magnesium/cobalt transporter CorA n=1 Tax=Croceivirga lutea TaxID=1775167 RepID=UPI00163A9764|nr:magnesium/cobalt transporter CorA [Croceivirga lutea]GGG44760.1 magnesium and cobalt transport protein CorA [Croceivirga lutea]
MPKKPTKIKLPKSFRSKSKLGKAPGAINYVGARKEQLTQIAAIEYNDSILEGFESHYSDLKERISPELTSFVNIVGLAEESTIDAIGKSFGLNNLLLEDLVDTLQRPKVDEFDKHIFGVFKMLYLNPKDELIIEHVALVLMEGVVLVFQETKDDVFDGVKNRIAQKFGRIRSRGADYLYFALIDAIVDNYYVVLDEMRDRIELLEEEVYERPTEETAKKIQLLKKEIIRIRKWIFPVKDLISRLIETEHSLFTKDTKLFLKDTLDHCIEINEDLTLNREMSTSLMEMYMTSVSNKMNEVMKVLTVIAAIFIPLTFLAGIYGMNFEYMPELQYRNGYFILWGVFLLVGIGLLIFFKRKGWL